MRDLFDLALLAASCRIGILFRLCNIISNHLTLDRLVLLGGLSGVRSPADRIIHGLIETLLVFSISGCLGSTRCIRELLETVASVDTTSGHVVALGSLIKDHVRFFLVRLAHGCKVKVS